MVLNPSTKADRRLLPPFYHPPYDKNLSPVATNTATARISPRCFSSMLHICETAVCDDVTC